MKRNKVKFITSIKMVRKAMNILLRVTSENNERFSSPVIFKTFSDAAKALGFTEQGIGKAYRSKKSSMKNSSGKYDFEWLELEEPSPKPKPATAPKRNLKLGLVKDSKTLNCFICEEPLTYEDRVKDGNTVEMLNKDGEVIHNTYYDSIYHIHKGTRICRNALIYAANHGNNIIVRGDGAIFKVWWHNSHSDCFEKKKKDKLLERRKKMQQEWEDKMSDPVKREEYYRSKEREEQEEKELRAKQREEIIAAIRGGLPYKHELEDCTDEIRMLIEKEEEAKFYRDIEAGLPFSEQVANRLVMLEYAKRYTSNHIDEKRLQELRENGKLKAIIKTQES